jgi:hypothetical protein
MVTQSDLPRCGEPDRLGAEAIGEPHDRLAVAGRRAADHAGPAPPSRPEHERESTVVQMTRFGTQETAVFTSIFRRSASSPSVAFCGTQSRS